MSTLLPASQRLACSREALHRAFDEVNLAAKASDRCDPALWRLVADAAELLLKPVAQRHPYALVGAAALLGGLLVQLRPWRWVAPSAWLSVLLPVLLAQAMRHKSAAAHTSADAMP